MRRFLPLLSGLAGVAIGVALIKGLIEASRRVDELAASASELADQASGVGVAVEEFQALRGVFQQVGLDGDDVNDALNAINVKLGEAAAGSDTAMGAFSALGIQIRNEDGTLRSLTAVWRDLVGAVQEGGSPRTAAAIATILGGDLGRKLLPLLMQSEEAYKRLVDEAGKLVSPQRIIDRLAQSHVNRLLEAQETQVAWNRTAAVLAPLFDVINRKIEEAKRLMADVLTATAAAALGQGHMFGPIGAAVAAFLGSRGEVTDLADEVDRLLAELQDLVRLGDITPSVPVSYNTSPSPRD